MIAVLLVAGVVLLLVGAEILIRGAARLAQATGLSPLVVGLTVVAFGTSAPELAIGLDAAWSGAPDIAVGNVVGSNIANILLILGLSALIAPLVVSRQLIRLDIPVMVLASVVVYLLALNGRISRTEGGLLMAAAVVYTATLIRLGRQRAAAGMRGVPAVSGAPGAKVRSRLWRDLAWVLLGLGGLALGAHWLVKAAVAIAMALGVSSLVIGLTIVAVGTSLPEIATTLIAARRGQREIAVGNIVGSNIFNLLLVLGASAAASPVGMPMAPTTVTFDLPVMTAVAIACLPIFFNSHRIARWEGAVFLGYYAAYLLFLALSAGRHHALPWFTAFMTGFALPLTAITLAVVIYRNWRRSRRDKHPLDTNDP